VTSVCSEGHTIFTSWDSNCSTWCKVKNGEEESENEMNICGMSSNCEGYL
jgi:hypothetical protein